MHAHMSSPACRQSGFLRFVVVTLCCARGTQSMAQRVCGLCTAPSSRTLVLDHQKQRCGFLCGFLWWIFSVEFAYKNTEYNHDEKSAVKIHRKIRHTPRRRNPPGNPRENPPGNPQGIPRRIEVPPQKNPPEIFRRKSATSVCHPCRW